MSTAEFTQEFQAISHSLRLFARKLTQNNQALAEDLFQETACKAFSNRNNYQPNTNMKAWLLTIMKNIFINEYRKTKRRKTFQDNSPGQSILHTGTETVMNDGESNLAMQELHGMLNQLEDGLRIPFLMQYQGIPYQEIAEHMQLPIGTVKSRIHFARKHLKDMILARNQVHPSLVVH